MSSTLSKPLRLDQQLLEDAERESKLVRRSIPKQIEHWADLGRHVERFLSRNDLIALQQGLVKITITPDTIEPVDVDDVFASLQADVDSGSFMVAVRGKGDFVYEASTTVEGLLDKVFKTGERITGKFDGGQFIPS